MSFFESLDLVPDDPLFAIPPLFAADARPYKVDLSLGVYQDDHGQNTVLECVRQAEKLMLERQLDKKYLTMDGHSDYINQTLKLIFGEGISRENIYAAQTIGGTGALGIGARLLRQISGNAFISRPSWANHQLIFSKAGLSVSEYPYYDFNHHRLLFDELCGAIKQMPAGSILLLHACCHNPTGVDPSDEQWRQLSALIKQQKLIPFFDLAYQGFGDSLQQDSSMVRYFYEQGHEMALAYSFSKNLGLYGERVGLLAVTAPHPEIRQRIGSQVKQIARSIYSMPPLQGERIAHTVLSTESLRQLWVEELNAMRTRIQAMRQQLASGLSAATQQDFSFIAMQRGLFSFCGLSAEQTLQIRQSHAIFMPSSGRINIAALNSHNIDHVVKALADTFKK